jgi:FSR family fosmidomycin resistance protein-like MFS transporter
MAGAGVSLAGIGLGMSGVLHGYALVWMTLFASGLGVAMFHPAAGKAARSAAGDSTSAMSIFATGGNVGFFLAPVLATPALGTMRLGATVLFIPRAVLTGFVLLRHQRHTAPARHAARAAGTDRWGPFLLLVAVEVTRSVIFFGTSTFIELYWIAHLHASRPVAGVALTCFLTGGVAGTLLGGRLADRFGLTRTVLVGNAAAIPALIALRACPGAGLALVAALAAGVTVRIPFSVLVKLGQDYLPSRPGTAAGVTLGLAVSAGGLAAPYSAPSPRLMALRRCSRSCACCRYPPWRCPCYCPNRSVPAECARRQGDRCRSPDCQRDRVPDRERHAVLEHAAQAGGQRTGGQ